MTIFGRVVRWLRGRPVWAGNRYDPGDSHTPARNVHALENMFLLDLLLVVIDTLVLFSPPTVSSPKSSPPPTSFRTDHRRQTPLRVSVFHNYLQLGTY